MVSLDLKDKKILYELDLDSRQPISKIGKKVGLPKTSVAYHINKMEELGVIRHFYTVIDAYKLGYTSIRIYLTFQYASLEKRKEILQYFIDNKFTYWIGTIEGPYDLVVIMWIRELYEFHQFWKQTLSNYRDYFQEESFSIYMQLLHFPNTYLLDDHPTANRKVFEKIGGRQRVDIDDLDLKILDALSKDARIPLLNLAQQTQTSAATVSKRIKQLREKRIIQGFRTDIDIAKMGYKQFKIDIDLRDYKKIDTVSQYIRENPHLIYITVSAGHADLELSFRFASVAQVSEVMDDLYCKFPNVIRSYHYFYVTKIHKLQYMPQK
jgi:Lrp/AsnC family leucine-responsive transcriptional regulator